MCSLDYIRCQQTDAVALNYVARANFLPRAEFTPSLFREISVHLQMYRWGENATTTTPKNPYPLTALGISLHYARNGAYMHGSHYRHIVELIISDIQMSNSVCRSSYRSAVSLICKVSRFVTSPSVKMWPFLMSILVSKLSSRLPYECSVFRMPWQ
jgi:hypothetical protein